QRSCTASLFLSGYHAHRLSDNLINPIAPPALCRYFSYRRGSQRAGPPATPTGQDHLLKFKSLERSPSLPQEIVASLTGALRAGELRPGDRLPSEQALATEFGVARTVVREAISQLKYDGIVQSRVGVGAFIAQPQERTAFRISPECFKKRKELLKLLRLRNGVVSEAAADAAQARSNRDIARMEAILKEMRDAASDSDRGAERHFEAERQLIHAIAKVADNEHALNFIVMIDSQIAEKLRSVAVKNTKATELAAVAI